jgi:hypothetical protein
MCYRNGSETVYAVEIRIVLDTIDPPAGHLQVTARAAPARDDPGRTCDEMSEVFFTGWPDLLRALVTSVASEVSREHRRPDVHVGGCGDGGAVWAPAGWKRRSVRER